MCFKFVISRIIIRFYEYIPRCSFLFGLYIFSCIIPNGKHFFQNSEKQFHPLVHFHPTARPSSPPHESRKKKETSTSNCALTSKRIAPSIQQRARNIGIPEKKRSERAFADYPPVVSHRRPFRHPLSGRGRYPDFYTTVYTSGRRHTYTHMCMLNCLTHFLCQQCPVFFSHSPQFPFSPVHVRHITRFNSPYKRRNDERIARVISKKKIHQRETRDDLRPREVSPRAKNASRTLDIALYTKENVPFPFFFHDIVVVSVFAQFAVYASMFFFSLALCVVSFFSILRPISALTTICIHAHESMKGAREE